MVVWQTKSLTEPTVPRFRQLFSGPLHARCLLPLCFLLCSVLAGPVRAQPAPSLGWLLKTSYEPERLFSCDFGEPHRAKLVDVDEDGFSELLDWYRGPDLPTGPSLEVRVRISRVPGFNIIQQTNFVGMSRVTGVLVEDVWAQPGREILIAASARREVVLRVWNPFADRTKDIVVYRYDDPEAAEWAASIKPVACTDVDNDGDLDVLLVMDTGYGRLPRGVMACDLQTGEVIWRYDMGSLPYIERRPPVITDFGLDGRLELVLGTSAPQNKVFRNGTDDLHSYVFVLDLSTGQLLRRWRMLPYFSLCNVLDVDPATGTIFVGAQNGGSVAHPPRAFLARCSVATGRVETHEMRGYADIQLFRDVDGDGMVDFLAHCFGDGVYRVYDRDFQLLREFPMPPALRRHRYRTKAADLDRDGSREILCFSQFGEVHVLGEAGHSAEWRDLQATDLVGAGYVRVGARGSVWAIAVLDRAKPPYSRISTYHVRRQTVLPFGLRARALVLALAIGLGLAVAVRATREAVRRWLHSEDVERAFRHASFGIMQVDARGTVVRINAAGRRILGMENQIVDGLHFADAFANPSLSAFRQALRESLEGRIQEFSRELPIRRDGGDEFVSFNVIRARLGRLRGWGRLVLFHRIRKTDPFVERRCVALTQRIAHDVKNPLTAIQLSIDQLEKEISRTLPEVSPRFAPLLERIRARAERLHAMMRRYQKLTDLASVERQLLELGAFLGDWAESKRSKLPEDISLECEPAQGEVPAEADRELLEELLDNLLACAVDEMPEGGTVTVRASIQSTGAEDGDGDPATVRIELEHTGAREGAPATEQDAGSPHSASRWYGTHLLLFIVERIVEEHRGAFEIVDEPGGCRKFVVSFPKAMRNESSERG